MTMHTEQVFYFNFTLFHLHSPQPFTLCKHVTIFFLLFFFLDPVTSHMTFINTPTSYRNWKDIVGNAISLKPKKDR